MSAPTILIVEDEISIQKVIRTYLESENFQVVCVDNGPEALTLARELKPELIILCGYPAMKFYRQLRWKIIAGQYLHFYPASGSSGPPS